MRVAWCLGLVAADDYERPCVLDPVRVSTLPAGRGLDRGEITALFDTCATGALADIRDAALLAALYGSGGKKPSGSTSTTTTGSTASDAYAAKAPSNASPTSTLRRRRPRRLDRPTQGGCWAAINTGGRLDLRRLSGQAVRLILRKRARLAGVAESSPQDARRSFVSEPLDQGADIAVVAGLASVTITARYDRRGDEAKRDAARLLQPPTGDPQHATRSEPKQNCGAEPA